jgi:hypothetical protein
MISEFYYGTAWKWPIPYLPRIMISAGFARSLKTPYSIDKPWMMDSGIGGMFKEGSKPRITIDEYAEIIRKWNPSVAWTYDFPCEPSIRVRYGYDPKEAQNRTNKSTIYLRDKLGMENVMSVVQGWSTRDYVSNIELIKNQGLLTERLGIGSICRRGQIAEINRIIRNVKRNLPGWVKLHGFGVKIPILQTEARFYLHSADSMSWAIVAFGKYANGGKGQTGITISEKLPYLLEYVNRIETIINRPMPITLGQVPS